MKKALIIIGAVIAILLIVAAILPSTVHVERSIEVKAPVEVVFAQVNDLRQNFNWSPWMEYDPEMAVEWGEITSGVGASYSWSGNSDVGNGTLTIVESVENEFIRNEIDFGEMGKGQGTWKFESVYVEDNNGELAQGDISVTWGMDLELDWPVGRFFGLFMDGMVGADFEKGLSKLKEVSEMMPVAPKYEVMEVDVQEMTLIVTRDSSAMQDIGESMGRMMGQLYEFVTSNSLEMAGAPVCVYEVWNMEEGYTVMASGIPVPMGTELELAEGFEMKVVPAGKAAKVVYMGAYDKLSAAHYAIDEWISSNAKEIAGPPWESYLSDPMSEPDTSKWLTEIYYPIQ